MKIGMITIGQSPRDDVVPEIIRTIRDTSDLEIIQKGALDGLKGKQLDKIRAKEETKKKVFVTRLNDGSEIKVDKKKLMPKFEEKINELDKKVDLITYLCAGKFPEFKTETPILDPNKLVKGYLQSFEIDSLGLMIPSPDQLSVIPPQYEALGFEVEAVSYSPYEGIDIAEKAKAMKGCELIFLDCFGYTIEMKEKVREITDTPTVLTRTILARGLAELI